MAYNLNRYLPFCRAVNIVGKRTGPKSVRYNENEQQLTAVLKIIAIFPTNNN
jgi:hypothetical protein